MGADAKDGQAPLDRVGDEEELYRRVREEFVRVEAGSTVRFSANAFNDRERKPSVDRAALLDGQPQRTRISPSDAVARLIAHDVRAIAEVAERTPAGQIVGPYRIDVVPDPIRNDPQLPDNPAHARIQADRELNNSAFKHLKEILAGMAEPELLPFENR
jgi:hypothetical protein